MQLLTIEKLSAQLDVPKSWIYRQVRNKENPLPKIKLGKYLRFEAEAIAAYLDKNRG